MKNTGKHSPNNKLHLAAHINAVTTGGLNAFLYFLPRPAA